MKTDEPNVYVFQANQLSTNAIPAYLNPIAISPHLDELAAASIFGAAHCDFVLCTPSRLSMLSGHLASIVGAVNFHLQD